MSGGKTTLHSPPPGPDGPKPGAGNDPGIFVMAPHAEVLPRERSLIGMIHIGALPGSPFGETSIELIAAQAAAEARLLTEAGFDAIIIENMHDRPYRHGDHGPEVAAAMTRIALEVEAVTQLPLGVQVLSGGNRDALAIAVATGASFIRCENFVFAHVADEGLLARAEAGELLRYRRAIGAEHVAVFADIKKKHASHAITADISIEAAAEAALFFGASGLIVTGAATGQATDPADVARVARVASQATLGGAGAPVLVGSGVTPETVGPLFEHAAGLIVGSWIKHDGVWSNEPDPARCRAMVEAADAAR